MYLFIQHKIKQDADGGGENIKQLIANNNNTTTLFLNWVSFSWAVSSSSGHPAASRPEASHTQLTHPDLTMAQWTLISARPRRRRAGGGVGGGGGGRVKQLPTHTLHAQPPNRRVLRWCCRKKIFACCRALRCFFCCTLNNLQCEKSRLSKAEVERSSKKTYAESVWK